MNNTAATETKIKYQMFRLDEDDDVWAYLRGLDISAVSPEAAVAATKETNPQFRDETLRAVEDIRSGAFSYSSATIHAG
jgi:hypothetical protein